MGRALGLSLFLFNSVSSQFAFNASSIRRSRTLLLVFKHLTNEFILPISGKHIPFYIYFNIYFCKKYKFYRFNPLYFYSFKKNFYYFKSSFNSMVIPLIVLIELVRNFIRPITLSVRLAANIVAGHLLIRLINGGSLSLSRAIFIILGGLILFFLEIAVAFIQGYVFSTLSVMYFSELNSSLVANKS